MKVLLFTFLSLFVSSTYAQIDKNENGVFDKYLKVKKVSDRVLIVGSGSNYYTAVIGIKTEKGLVAIDAGISPLMTARYRKNIEQEFGRNDFIYLINTHGHDDHTSGNQVFSDVPIIAHENCKPDMMEFWSDTAKAVAAWVSSGGNAGPRDFGLWRRAYLKARIPPVFKELAEVGQ